MCGLYQTTSCADVFCAKAGLSLIVLAQLAYLGKRAQFAIFCRSSTANIIGNLLSFTEHSHTLLESHQSISAYIVFVINLFHSPYLGLWVKPTSSKLRTVSGTQFRLSSVPAHLTITAIIRISEQSAF